MQQQQQQQQQQQHHPPHRRKSHVLQTHLVSPVEDKLSKGDKPTWFEVFINLFYLAFLIKLGDIFLYCHHSLEIYMYTIAMFLGIYMNKFEMDLYLSKYGFNDLVNKTFHIVYSIGIFIMIINVNATTVEFGNSGVLLQFHQECHEYRSYVVGFSVGWLITRGSLLGMYLIISYTLSDTYILISKVPILVFSLLIVMLNLILRDDTYDDDYSSVKFLLSAALIEYLGFAFWQMFIVGTILHPCIHHFMATVKVNVNQQTTRTAAFGLVTLGVNVVELMTPILHSSGVRHYVSLFFGFVITLSLSMNFFDVIPAKGDEHALSNSKLQGTAWMMLQPVLSYCIFGVGMILKMLLSEDIDDSLHEQESDITLGIFLGLASLLLMFIRLTHRVRSTMNKGRWVTAFCRLVVSLGHFLVGFFLGHPRHVHISLSAHAALCAIYVLIDAAKYTFTTEILYLQIWTSQAREDDVVDVDNQSDISNHNQDGSSVSSTAGGGNGRGQTMHLTRNLSEAKIQIPGRFLSSSSIIDTSASNQPRGGNIQMTRKLSDGKILMTRRPSDGRIQLPQRSLSFASSSSMHSHPEGLGEKPRKQVAMRRHSRSSESTSRPTSPPSTKGSRHDRIRIARQFKSSTNIGGERGGSVSPSGGSVVKNEKGQFVLETMVMTPNGGQKVQHTVLHRVVTKKKNKNNKDKDKEKDNEGWGGGTTPNVIVVRKIKSTSNATKPNNNSSSLFEDTAKAALQNLEHDDADDDDEPQGGNDLEPNNDDKIALKKNHGRKLETQGSSVIMVEDENEEADMLGEKQSSSVKITTLSRGASLTLSGSASLLTVKEK